MYRLSYLFINNISCRDKYWNVTATVPKHASALLLSGGLDPQTERSYARTQYALMRGERRLIEFPNAAHCTTFTTPTLSVSYSDIES